MSHQICCICDSPIHFTSIGAGDGSGNKFAHPECYWKARANNLELSLREAKNDVSSLRSQLQVVTVELLRTRETLLDEFASSALSALLPMYKRGRLADSNIESLAFDAYSVAYRMLERRKSYLKNPAP